MLKSKYFVTLNDLRYTLKNKVGTTIDSTFCYDVLRLFLQCTIENEQLERGAVSQPLCFLTAICSKIHKIHYSCNRMYTLDI